jgi:hypothetical protein
MRKVLLGPSFQHGPQAEEQVEMRSRTIGALVATAVALALPPAAQADSILYVKAGDVWLSTPDGARQYRVTTTGGYSYASQADDGTIIALAPNERLHKLARDGRVLADFPTFVSDGAPVGGAVNQFAGPFEPEISPDGTKVAFEWINSQFDNTAGCSATSVPPCHVLTSRQGVGITSSSGFTGFEDYGLMTGWIYPSWVSDTTLVRSDSGAVLNDHAVFTNVGPGLADSQLDPWFFDDLAGGLVSDVELSRDRKVVVGVVGVGKDKLRVYRPLVDPFDAPNWNHTPFAQGNQHVVEPCYEYGDPIGGRFESVSIAPDARHIAYGVADGIWVSNVPELSASCAQATENELRIPGGQYPDWGPADVPAAPTGSNPPTTPGGSGSPAPPVPTQPAKALSLRVACRSACRVSATAVAPAAVARAIGTKNLATGSGKRSRRGTVKVVLTPTRRGAEGLRRLAGRRVQIKVKVAEGKRTRTLTRQVTV